MQLQEYDKYKGKIEVEETFIGGTKQNVEKEVKKCLKKALLLME